MADDGGAPVTRGTTDGERGLSQTDAVHVASSIGTNADVTPMDVTVAADDPESGIPCQEARYASQSPLVTRPRVHGIAAAHTYHHVNMQEPATMNGSDTSSYGDRHPPNVNPLPVPTGIFSAKVSLPQQSWPYPTGTASMVPNSIPQLGPHPFPHLWHSVNNATPQRPGGTVRRIGNIRPPVDGAIPVLKGPPIVITPRDGADVSTRISDDNQPAHVPMDIKTEPQDCDTDGVGDSKFANKPGVAPPTTSLGTAVPMNGPPQPLCHPCTVCHLLFSHVGELEAHMLSHKNVLGAVIANGHGNSEQDKLSQATDFTSVPSQFNNSSECQPPSPSTDAAFDKLREICDIMSITQRTKQSPGHRYKYVCKFCSTVFYKKEHILRHADIRRKGKYKCKRCMLILCSWRKMRVHTYEQCSEVSLDAAGVYQCKSCLQFYATRQSLTFHESRSKCKDKSPNNKALQNASGKPEDIGLDMVCTTESPGKAAGTNSAQGSHVCSVCSKWFSTADALEKHLKYFQVDDGLMCIPCHATFTTVQTLMRHVSAHSEVQAYQCPACNKSYTRKQGLKDHFKDSKCSRAGNSATCAHCREVYLPKDAYWAHLKCDKEGKHCVECGVTSTREMKLNANNKCQGCQNKVHVCSDCGRIFDGQDDLTLHRKNSSMCTSSYLSEYERINGVSSTAVSLTDNADIAEPADISKMTTVHHCLVCGVMFDNYETYFDHRSTCRIQKIDNRIIAKTDQARLPKAIEPNLQPKHRCLLCRRSFSSAYALQKHKLGLEIHKCPRKIKNKSKQMTEMRFEIQYYECPVCSKMFISTWEIEDHIRSFSDKTKPNCPLCHMSFTYNGPLKRHMRDQHLMIRDYKCPVCNNTFTRVEGLQGHVEHSNCKLRKEEVMCDVCGVDYIPHSSLQEHICCGAVNGTYPCRSCGEIYNTRINLLRHRVRCTVTAKSDNDSDSKTVDPSLGQRRANVGPAGPALAQRWADDTLLSGDTHGHRGTYDHTVHLLDPGTTSLAKAHGSSEVERGVAKSQQVMNLHSKLGVPMPTSTVAKIHSDNMTGLGRGTSETRSGTRIIIRHAFSIYRNMPSGVYRCIECNFLFRSIHFRTRHRLGVTRGCKVMRTGMKGELLLPKGWGISLNGYSAEDINGSNNSKTKSAPAKSKPTAPRPTFHICDVCHKKFPDIPALEAHLKLFEDERDLCCMPCHQTFSCRATYKRHMESIHKKLRKYECPVCHRTVKRREQFISHMERKCGISDKSIQCSVCGEEYVPRDNYIGHLKCVNNVRLRTCKKCYAGFLSVKQLRHHQDTCCKDESRKSRLEDEFVITIGGEHSQEAVGISKSIDDTYMEGMSSDRTGAEVVNTNAHQCPVCQGLYTNSFQLQRHLGNVHVAEPAIECPICSRILPNKRSYDAHSRRHRTDKPEECVKCRKVFASKEVLEEHLANHPQAPFSCTICGKGYHVKNQLARHYKIHPGYQGIECNICHEKFEKLMDYRYHLNSHRGETKYLCSICGATLKSERGLKGHMVIKHTKEKNVQCELCPRKFGLQEQLRRHMDLHIYGKQYLCSLCPKRFASELDLKTHFRKHTGEMPFSCEICGKRFHRKVTYDQHLRVHGEKKHVCDECGLRFSERGYLTRHMKQRHPKSAYVSRINEAK